MIKATSETNTNHLFDLNVSKRCKFAKLFAKRINLINSHYYKHKLSKLFIIIYVCCNTCVFYKKRSIYFLKNSYKELMRNIFFLCKNNFTMFSFSYKVCR